MSRVFKSPFPDKENCEKGLLKPLNTKYVNAKKQSPIIKEKKRSEFILIAFVLMYFFKYFQENINIFSIKITKPVLDPVNIITTKQLIDRKVEKI